MSTPAARHESVMDPTALSLAGVYAEAFLGAADEAGLDAQAAAAELGEVAEALRTPEGALLLDPETLGRDARVRCVEAIFAGRASEPVTGLLSVMARRGRLSLIRPTLWRLTRLIQKRLNQRSVEVSSAVALDEKQQRRITEQLRQALGAEPIIAFRVNERLLGGLRVRVGDDVYDASMGVGIERLCRQIHRAALTERLPLGRSEQEPRP